MLGRQNFAPKFCYQLRLDGLVPKDQLLRRIASAIDFSFVYSLAQPYGETVGGPRRAVQGSPDWISLWHHLGAEVDGRGTGEPGLPGVSGI